MPLAIRRYFEAGQSPDGTEKEPVTRLAWLLASTIAIVAGGYFALLYVLSRG